MGGTLNAEVGTLVGLELGLGVGTTEGALSVGTRVGLVGFQVSHETVGLMEGAGGAGLGGTVGA